MNSSNLSLYHIFDAVVKAGSISKAANDLYISQPAVSKAIQRLEESLDTVLLIRNSRGVALTNEGRILSEYIHNAFETITAGESSLKHINELGIGHIKIGVSSTLCKHVLLPKLKSFLSMHPHTQITIECQSSIHTVKLLENKDIDIGLIVAPNARNLSVIPAGQLQDTFVATPQYIHSLYEREHVSKKQILENSNLILLDKKNMTRQFIETYLNKWKINTEKTMEVNSMDLLIDFVKTGLGTGCVIRQFVEEEINSGQLIEIPTPGSIPTRNISFAYLRGTPLTGVAKLFIDYISDTSEGISTSSNSF